MTNADDPDPLFLPGSARVPAPGAAGEKPLDPHEAIEFTVVLRRRADGQLGADPDDLAAVPAALTSAGLEIVRTDAPSRRIRVRAPVSTVNRVFSTSLARVSSTAPDGRTVTHRQRTGDLAIPAALRDRVIAVLGLDDRPQARAQFRIAGGGTGTSFTPLQIGTAYAFPEGTDGTGQTVAIIELGGGFAHSDLDSYFGSLGVSTPKVTAKSVDGAKNEPGKDPQGADGEVLLDIEVIGALAPKAAIDVYFAPNTDAGFLDAVSDAIHASPTPAAVSISWGQSEDAWTAQARAAMDAAFADAVQLGVVVTAAAGDRGSGDGGTDGKDHCDFPASSPNVLGCGGTRLELGKNGVVTAETVWNDNPTSSATGGGVSTAFPQPPWQANIGVPATGRGVPDVAGNADPQTGYQVLVDGNSIVIGGTSAVAPLWAALAARLAQATGGPLKDFLPSIYAGASTGTSPPGFRDVTHGSNGTYSAGPGWDACTGLGSPDGTALLARLKPG